MVYQKVLNQLLTDQSFPTAGTDQGHPWLLKKGKNQLKLLTKGVYSQWEAGGPKGLPCEGGGGPRRGKCRGGEPPLKDGGLLWNPWPLWRSLGPSLGPSLGHGLKLPLEGIYGLRPLTGGNLSSNLEWDIWFESGCVWWGTEISCEGGGGCEGGICDDEDGACEDETLDKFWLFRGGLFGFLSIRFWFDCLCKL